LKIIILWEEITTVVYSRSRASKSEAKRMVGNLKQTVEFGG
jgi:hypothetical protein